MANGEDTKIPKEFNIFFPLKISYLCHLHKNCPVSNQLGDTPSPTAKKSDFRENKKATASTFFFFLRVYY